jgi:capsular exopolysaccharide synthesis family protein
MDAELDERSSMAGILEYLQLLWHWTWLLVLAALISGAVTYYYTDQQPRFYQSSTLVTASSASGSVTDPYSAVYNDQQLAITYSKTMLTSPVIDEVSKRLGFPIKAKINIQNVTDTALMEITVTDKDPEKTALIANMLVTVFSEKIHSEQTSRYTELLTGLEKEITNLDTQIGVTQQKLASLIASLDPKVPADSVTLFSRSQYEEVLSQYQQSRIYFVQYFQDIKLTEAQFTSSLIQEDPAVPDTTPIQPQPMRSAIMAAVVGFLIAAGIILMIGFLDDTIRDPEEITRRWGLPVLGLIASYNYTQNPIITMSQPRAPVSEAFRSLRTNLQFAEVNNPVHTLLVTSTSPAEGKTSVVANLANVIAQNDREVVVIDADLRRPGIHKIFKLSNSIGLTDYFILAQNLMNGMVKATDTNRLSVITSGNLPPNPSELLSSDKMKNIISILGEHFNSIILDTPPLLAVTDALVLAPHMDGVILIIDPKKSKRGAIKHAIEELRRVNANVLGVVLNNVKVKWSHYYYNRNYYFGKDVKEPR